MKKSGSHVFASSLTESNTRRASLTCRLPLVIIKITISSLVIGLKKSYFPPIRLPSCYRTVCYWIVYYRTVQQANHIQSCNYVCVRARAFVFLPVTLRMFTPPLSVFYCEFPPIFNNLAIFLFLGNCNFYD